MSDNPEIVVFVTTASSEEAEKIATSLVENHLAACVNLLPKLKSIYLWEGKLCKENEVLMMIKSQRRHFTKLEAAIKSLHSYALYEIIALPIVAGSEDYLRWIRESTSI